MRREDIVEMFKRLPEPMHQYVNFVMRNQAIVSAEVVARFEPTYLVLRGREGGTTDEGRAFFIPYDEIAYVRIEQVLKLGQLKRLYGEEHADAEDRLARDETDAKGVETPAPVSVDLTPPPAAAPSDPASIAKQNLLDRIRAARANAAGAPTGKLGGK